MAQPLETLLIGPSDDPMFADAVAMLQANCRVDSVNGAGEIASQRLGRIDLIVLLQRRPGECDERAIEAVRFRHPTVRVFQVVGSWCEGETRTGRPMPAAIRVAWHEAAAWFSREFAELSAGRCPAWGLPVTAGNDEYFQSAARRRIACGNQGLIVIHSPHADSAHLLGDICRTAGYAAAWARPDEHTRVHGAVAAIWDGATLDADEASSVERFAQRISGVPIVAILDFPRLDRVQATPLLAHFLARPFSIEGLIDRLDHCARTIQRQNLASRVA